MAVLRIAVIGHPILRQVAEPIAVEQIPSPAVQGLIADMWETLQDYEGAGLAAPQVHVPLRLVLCVMEEGPRILINPVLTPLTYDTIFSYEGCLSIPGMRAKVGRGSRIRLQGLDQDGEAIDEELEGWDATVAQHECDHLDGVLFVDKCDIRTLAFEDPFRRFGPLDESGEE